MDVDKNYTEKRLLSSEQYFFPQPLQKELEKSIILLRSSAEKIVEGMVVNFITQILGILPPSFIETCKIIHKTESEK